MKYLFAILLIVNLLPTVSRAAEQTPPRDQKARESYALGYEFGSNLKNNEVDVDENILLSAIRDALKGANPAVDSKEIIETLKLLRQKILVKLNLRREEIAVKNKEEGKAFLAMNKTKEGVRTFPSGLQYKVLNEGKGSSPQATDKVMVNYRGTMINGAEFDSSYSRGEPVTVNVNGVIRGWSEALQHMKPGSKWQLFVPAELAYGERSYNSIPPNSVLVFELELLSVEKNTGSAGTGPQTAKESVAAVPDKGGERPSDKP